MKDFKQLIHSAEELKKKAEFHQSLLSRALKDNGESALEDCFIPECGRCRSLRASLAEAVEVIEGTRKSFKSKQLEMLRKKMIRVLVDSH